MRWLLFYFTSLTFLSNAVAHTDQRNYVEQIKPLLTTRCYACHGALKQEAGLRLDTVESMWAGGDSGPVLVAGDAEESLLLLRVRTEDVSERMPPEHEGEAFSAAQVELLRKWIQAGAVGPSDEAPEPDPKDHWAFQPLVRPAVPVDPIIGEGMPVATRRNPIDAFIDQRLQHEKLIPASEADPLLLLRRVSFDLWGLPPTSEEIAALQSVMHDSESLAAWYVELVERKLADPRHGQRWARHWMDIWRFSDWWGLGDELRNSQKNIYHWRDWIVDNVNADRSYASMLEMMLAADELAPENMDDLRATGFLARNFYLFNRHPWMEETVEHVGKAFLGLTTNCAKCHDHKYDPLSQSEYYQLRAFFEPYHVRTDMLPGQADIQQAGVPRVFDGAIEEPTYRLIRGDEKHPDISTVIKPAVPQFLDFAELQIEPVQLPLEAWQPGSRSWVIENYRKRAQQQVQSASEAVRVAEQRSVAAEKHLAQLAVEQAANTTSPNEQQVAPSTLPTVLLDDDFQTLDSQHWEWFGGDWEHQAHQVLQKQDGAQHATMRWLGRLPRDFEVTVRFRIRGGSQWRSVGVSFDESQTSPLSPLTTDDTAQNVYVSAYAGGPKVQAAWRQGPTWHYPTEAMKANPIDLDRSYTLRIQVRDTLINAYLDDQLMIAWRTPLARRDGYLQLTTFDALATFDQVKISSLPSDSRMQEVPGYQPDPHTLNGARWHAIKAQGEWQTAKQQLAVAHAEVESVQQRGQAMRHLGEADETIRGEAERRAVAAERRANIELARLNVLKLELQQRLERVLKEAATGDSVAGGDGEVSPALQEARARLAAAEAKLADPTTEWTRLEGAKWSPTRFRFSGSDDPAMAFSPISTGRRTAFAKWVTHPRNPLTARVAVNHLWTRHFGTPLVESVFDFGRNGAKPTHPELLDWLACELIDNDWSMKHLHRLIMHSAAYRRASSVPTEIQSTNLSLDPDNRGYWRFPTNRLESQVVRDSLLELAGQLDVSSGGPPILPGQQADSIRRSLYFFHSNNQRNDFLVAFDEASVAECYRREQSVVPQQALALANGDLTTRLLPLIAKQIEASLRLSEQNPIAAEHEVEFIRAAFVFLLGRDAAEPEQDYCQQAVVRWHASAGENLTELERRQAAREQLVWVLLNHSDFITVK